MNPQQTRERLIFLDIDGVLNGHTVYEWDLMPKPLIARKCVLSLNKIIEATSAAIVVSSSWRYMVHSGSMTVRGFEQMFRTHGIRGSIIDITRPDGEDEARAAQIADWLKNAPVQYGPYVVLDDDEEAGGDHPFIRTSPAVGLTDADADLAIRMLME